MALLAAALFALACQTHTPLAAPAGEDTTRIAWIGCHRQDRPAPALARYLELSPDYVLWIGDNVYADTRDDVGFIEACYARLAARPEFDLLRAAAPFLVTWDDHDYGLNNAGREYPLKAESRALFRRFWRLEELLPEEREGVYHAHMLDAAGHSLQVILLDPRTHRDRPGPGSDTLGEAQWTWLTHELARPADLRLIVSGFQVLLDADSGSETWAEFPEARARLFRAIRESGAERVVFLTGDQHYGEVCRLPGALDHDAVELQFAGVNQGEEPERNATRVSEVATATHKLAWLDIHWRGNEHDVPHFDFVVADAFTGARLVRYRTRFDELEVRPELPPGADFVGTHRVELRRRFPELVLRGALGAPDAALDVDASSPELPHELCLSDSTQLVAQYFTRDGHPRGRAQHVTWRRLRPIPAPRTDLEALQPGFAAHVFEGAWPRIPAFSRQAAVAELVAASLDLEALAPRPEHFGIRFEGQFRAEVDGLYRFSVRSDDGSRLWIAGVPVVENDGSHSARRRSGELPLARGAHPLRLDYFQDTEGATLQVDVSRDGGPWAPLELWR